MIPLLDSLSREDRTLAELELASREGALVVIARELEQRRRLLDAAESRLVGGGVKPWAIPDRGQEQLEQKVLRESLVSSNQLTSKMEPPATSLFLHCPRTPTPHHRLAARPTTPGVYC